MQRYCNVIAEPERQQIAICVSLALQFMGNEKPICKNEKKIEKVVDKEK